MLATIRKGVLVKMIAFALLAVVSGAISATVPFHPLSDEFIDHINSLQTTWKAGRNFAKDTPLDHIKHLLGALKNENQDVLETVHHVKGQDEVIPESFDARENWPKCESIRTIRDQSDCGSCWAVAAAAAMSDRICIASNGTDQTLVSDEDLTSCCWSCGYGCNGGYPYMAWLYWKSTGIVSGGPYNSKSGCRAYSMKPCEHHGTSGNLPKCESLDYNTPECVSKCDEGSSLTYKESKTYGSEVYGVSSSVEQIQIEIMRNGPVEAAFDVYSDFPNYKSGVYQSTVSEYLGGHAVRMIGWGVENGVSYWLITNSWNEGWGENGIFKILRGKDECGIESGIVAGSPRL